MLYIRQRRKAENFSVSFTRKQTTSWEEDRSVLNHIYNVRIKFKD